LHKVHALGRAKNVERLHNVRVGEPRHDRRLALEVGNLQRVGRALDDLDRHRRLRRQVAAEVDGRLDARADGALNLVKSLNTRPGRLRRGGEGDEPRVVLVGRGGKEGDRRAAASGF